MLTCKSSMLLSTALGSSGSSVGSAGKHTAKKEEDILPPRVSHGQDLVFALGQTKASRSSWFLTRCWYHKCAPYNTCSAPLCVVPVGTLKQMMQVTEHHHILHVLSAWPRTWELLQAPNPG